MREKTRQKLETHVKGKEPSPIDGIVRTPAQEQELNRAMAMCFRGNNGKIVLDYLASLSRNRVHGPDNLQTNSILHLEGCRFLYSVIAARQELGRKQKQ